MQQPFYKKNGEVMIVTKEMIVEQNMLVNQSSSSNKSVFFFLNNGDLVSCNTILEYKEIEGKDGLMKMLAGMGMQTQSVKDLANEELKLEMENVSKVAFLDKWYMLLKDGTIKPFV